MTIEQVGLFVGIMGVIGAFCVYQERRDKENQQEQRAKDDKLEASIAALGAKLENLWRTLFASQKDTVTHDVCSKRRESCPCATEIERLKEDLRKPKRRSKGE